MPANTTSTKITVLPAPARGCCAQAADERAVGAHLARYADYHSPARRPGAAPRSRGAWPAVATRRAAGSVAGHQQPACYSPPHAALSRAQRPPALRSLSACRSSAAWASASAWAVSVALILADSSAASTVWA
jgi:hypothetical protein